ncbi:hypothetical protein [Kocuria nitroreducens]|uniref:hypothetical protein n=1 Tax=Kocuria nitroreducens TaxID=3058914 RepID=UPI0036DC7279
MSNSHYANWVESIRDKAERFGVVFLQLGYNNEPARRALLCSGLATISVRDYMDNCDPRSPGPLVVDGIEVLAGHSAKTQDFRMGNLREQVVREVTSGASVILLSRAPRVAFPSVVGSSLLDDASFAHAPAVHARGPEEMPTCSEDGLDAAEVLNRTLIELGFEVCASLDRALYENQLVGDDALTLLNARELEALDGAGLTSPNASQRSWNFGTRLLPLKGALDHAFANMIEPQHQLLDISANLWKIERLIRRQVRSQAISAWGSNWRVQCLNEDLRAKTLQRATESAYLGANSVKQLRDPLEWLSLGELLSIKDRREIGDLGMSSTLWNQFRLQVMPIRNRLAHMRAIQAGDAADVVKWLRLIEKKLGSPSQ